MPNARITSMVRTAILFLLLHYIFLGHAAAQTEVPQRTDSVRISIQHISDIDFAKHEYKIEFWLKITSEITDSMSLIDIERQIAVEGAKDLDVLVIPDWSRNPNPHRKILKVNCTIVEDWDLDGYPFDKQKLNVKIYNAGRSLKYFRFVPYDRLIHYNTASLSDTIETENGWMFLSSQAIVNMDTVTDPFGDKSRNGEIKKYSAINYQITLFRVQRGWLFVKLLLGMYVAFFVSYTALFLNVKSPSRLELPVGGMFAAIANKYIIESILPQSPQFTLVDKLHSVTIVFILLILIYAIIITYLNRVYEKTHEGAEMPSRFNRRMIFYFTIAYVLLNMVIILKGYYQ